MSAYLLASLCVSACGRGIPVRQTAVPVLDARLLVPGGQEEKVLGSCRPACYGPVGSSLPCFPQRHDERRHAAMPMLLRAGPRCPGGQPPSGQRQDPPPTAKGQGRKGQLWSVEPRVGGKTPCGRVRRAAGGGESGTRDCGGRRAETLIVEHGERDSGIRSRGSLPSLYLGW